ncbi:unnamed protein product [Paramecium pentaurelia]|uniref:Uncharacterized protein n=1 Tax=Paramecium pentaurelia TaxID=43138 RepID=A0A8S1X973_9CILI|nr:unnamed protein product [Paramecium pentaurelia]
MDKSSLSQRKLPFGIYIEWFCLWQLVQIPVKGQFYKGISLCQIQFIGIYNQAFRQGKQIYQLDGTIIGGGLHNKERFKE